MMDAEPEIDTGPPGLLSSDLPAGAGLEEQTDTSMRSAPPSDEPPPLTGMSSAGFLQTLCSPCFGSAAKHVPTRSPLMHLQRPARMMLPIMLLGVLACLRARVRCHPPACLDLIGVVGNGNVGASLTHGQEGLISCTQLMHQRVVRRLLGPDGRHCAMGAGFLQQPRAAAAADV